MMQEAGRACFSVDSEQKVLACEVFVCEAWIDLRDLSEQRLLHQRSHLHKPQRMDDRAPKHTAQLGRLPEGLAPCEDKGGGERILVRFREVSLFPAMRGLSAEGHGNHGSRYYKLAKMAGTNRMLAGTHDAIPYNERGVF